MSSYGLITRPSSATERAWGSTSARKIHHRQQALLKQQNLPTCPGCHLCSLEIKQQMLRTKLFAGRVTILASQVALDESAGEHMMIHLRPRKTYWTSGVGPKESPSGYGIGIYRQFHSRSYYFQPNRNNLALDMLGVYAISHALQVAYNDLRDVEEERRPCYIRIYSDCMFALNTFTRFRKSLVHLRTRPKFRPEQLLILSGLVAAEDLCSLDMDVQLLYLPREGNSRADQAARRGARLPVPVSLDEPIPLTAECPTLPSTSTRLTTCPPPQTFSPL